MVRAAAASWSTCVRLLDAGLPTRIIAQLLPCLGIPGSIYCPEEASPEMLATRERERDAIDDSVATARSV